MQVKPHTFVWDEAVIGSEDTPDGPQPTITQTLVFCIANSAYSLSSTTSLALLLTDLGEGPEVTLAPEDPGFLEAVIDSNLSIQHRIQILQSVQADCTRLLNSANREIAKQQEIASSLSQTPKLSVEFRQLP